MHRVHTVPKNDWFKPPRHGCILVRCGSKVSQYGETDSTCHSRLGMTSLKMCVKCKTEEQLSGYLWCLGCTMEEAESKQMASPSKIQEMMKTIQESPLVCQHCKRACATPKETKCCNRCIGEKIQEMEKALEAKSTQR